MGKFLVARSATALAVLLAVSIVVFLVTNIISDPARALAGEGAQTDDIEAIRVSLGLDRPLIERYLDWLGALVRGDLGNSWRLRSPVLDVVWERLLVTLGLGASALGLAIAVGVPLGVAAAVRQGSAIDRFALLVAVVGQAIPTFWFGLLLIVFFGVQLQWLPTSGSETWAHYILPTVALGYYAIPEIMRLTRAGMLDVLSADFIRAARARGNGQLRILFRHALRPALLPVISLAAVQFGGMLSGSIIIETLFAIRGLGYLAWESLLRADIPVLQAIIVFVSLIYTILNLLADVLNAALDPRLRRG